LLKYIAQKAECHVIGVSTGEQDVKAWRALETVLPNVRVTRIVPRRADAAVALARLYYFLSFRPVSFCSFTESELRQALPEILAAFHYDLVHFDTFNLSEYREACSLLPTILVPHDAYSMGARRAMQIVETRRGKASYWWRWKAYSQYEKSEYRKFTKVCPVSEVDTQWLKGLDPAMDAETVGIPVADEFFVQARRDYANSAPVHIVACGLLSHDAAAEGMVEFLRQVYPIIRQALPFARITVWGRNPVPILARMLSALPEIEYVDFAPDYIEFLKAATLYVYPQRYGSGIQTKVQQPMAMGIPVVMRQHALDALGAKSGLHAFACDDNQEMAQAITQLARDENLRAHIGVAGAKHIRESYSGQVIGAKLEAVYQRAIDKHARR